MVHVTHMSPGSDIPRPRGVAAATMALTHNMSDGSVWNAARKEHLIVLEKTHGAEEEEGEE
jgi:hypothetical protein